MFLFCLSAPGQIWVTSQTASLPWHLGHSQVQDMPPTLPGQHKTLSHMSRHGHRRSFTVKIITMCYNMQMSQNYKPYITLLVFLTYIAYVTCMHTFKHTHKPACIHTQHYVPIHSAMPCSVLSPCMTKHHQHTLLKIWREGTNANPHGPFPRHLETSLHCRKH